MCTYDRSGLGRSAPDPVGRRSVQILVYDLRELLAKAGEPGPFLLVGKSMSAYTARLFAQQHPELVAGLVLQFPVHVALEPEMAAVLPGDARTWWAAVPERSEQIDFARSAALLNAPAKPPNVPVAIVATPASQVAAGYDGSLRADVVDDLEKTAGEIEERLQRRLDASAEPDVLSAVRKLLAAVRG